MYCSRPGTIDIPRRAVQANAIGRIYGILQQVYRSHLNGQLLDDGTTSGYSFGRQRGAGDAGCLLGYI